MTKLRLALSQTQTSYGDNMKCVFIYVLTDPRNGEIRYLGKTEKSLKLRLDQHLRGKNGKHTHVFRWIETLRKNGLIPKIETVQVVSNKDWQEAEKDWISKLRLGGINLTNHTDGGDGISGWKHSEETRKQLSVSRRKRPPHSLETRMKISLGGKGKKRSEVTKIKMRKAFKGRTMSLEARAKLSKAAKKQWEEGRGPDRGDLWKAKLSKSLKGRKLSEEQIEKMKNRVISPETRLKMSESQKKRESFSKEHREKISNSLKGKPKSPEHIESVRVANLRRRGKL